LLFSERCKWIVEWCACWRARALLMSAAATLVITSLLTTTLSAAFTTRATIRATTALCGTLWALAFGALLTFRSRSWCRLLSQKHCQRNLVFLGINCQNFHLHLVARVYN